MKSRIISFKEVCEEDGKLVFFEALQEIPFEIKRIFYIYDVPNGTERANHASKDTDFVLIPINGSVEVMLDDGYEVVHYQLQDKTAGLFVPRNTWMKTNQFSQNAILMVIASEEYSNSNYFQNYEEFKSISQK